jgi:hypothetical protein
MDHKEKSKRLDGMILEQSSQLQRLCDPRWAKWYNLALSDLLLLTDDAEVLFADTVVSGDDPTQAYSVRISIFTKHFIITVTAEVTGGEEHHATSARSRGDLRSMEVAAEVGALGDIWPSEWPGKVRVRLDYGDGEPLDLPGDKDANRDHHKWLVALLPSLRADLANPTT